ncbi:DNA-methyltransferase [Marinibactrum halimedae]|uniref:Methyltransferase n=1 Tax=Marinibactrum halimedae TaxID=1444977 RepID=A0AA37TET6_9GAMM|nr:site-specific DNA-methyltransferase [Marinibactrum halimedae]MCD9458030.1 site-specific DNA-methyltransferase [Marinibactrum halimedae]GLS27657.1 modification methylase HindIII [Marinibactrum halimedae]
MTEFINTILNGDCREMLKMLPSDYISACITDPPYNYEFIGHKWDNSEIQRRKERIQDSKTLVKNIPYGSGLAGGVRNKRWYEKNRQNILEYEDWCHEWALELYRVCKPGATILVFNSTRTVAHVQVALEKAGFYARDIVVYRRSSGIPKGINMQKKLEQKGFKNPEEMEGWHSCLRSEWEAICVLQKPLTNNYTETLIQHGTGLFYTKMEDGGFQSNILENIKRDKTPDYNIHCTVKPLDLMKKLINIFVPRTKGSIVLDPFAGSGTTLVAAKDAGLDYIGIEIEPTYIDIINQRLDHSDELKGNFSLL